MFGYVMPSLCRLTEEEKTAYNALYCGLCHTLGERYGALPRFLLNYDLTFLAALLTPELEIGQRRCMASPHKKKPVVKSSEGLALAADCLVIFSYHKLLDGVCDSAFPKREGYRAAAAALKRAYRKASGYRPRLSAHTREEMEKLLRLEKEECTSLDAPADTFAALLQGIALELPNDRQQRIFSHFFYHLGRWIYLVDALDDCKRDAASGSYNPILLRFDLRDGELTQEAREAMVITLDASVRQMAAAFELWEFGAFESAIKATVYDGLYRVGGAVLDGTFHQKKKRKKEQL